tara:strand:- start:439 stop:1377 length:939 start_codon:yes stop_codon:yes gene_type:complete
MKTKNLYIVILAVFSFLVIWIFIWFFLTDVKEKNFITWLQSSDKIKNFKYSKLKKKGFPNRIDLMYENFEVKTHSPDYTIIAKHFQIFNIIYQKNLTIISTNPEVLLKTKRNNYLLVSEKFLTSVKKNKKLFYTTITSEIDNLKINFNNKQSILINNLLFSSKINNDKKKNELEFFINSQNIKFNILDTEMDQLLLKGQFFDDNIQIIKLDEFILNGNLFDLNLKGKIQIKDNKIVGGKLNLNILGWKRILEYFKANDTINVKTFKLLNGGFSLIEIFQKNKKINFEIFFDEKFIEIGPVKINNNYNLADFF